MHKYIFSDYQKGQLRVIDEIEKQVKNDSVTFSIVAPVDDYESDPRITLTGVHFPKSELKEFIVNQIQSPLRKISPQHYYYSPDSLHMTIKNVRVSHDPPRFTTQDVTSAKNVFSTVLERHKPFQVYFYRLFLFKLNLALVGTTDPELDAVTLDLDRELSNAGIPDDKVYTNSSHFFAMSTLLRFQGEVTDEFKEKVEELSTSLNYPQYTTDTLSLVTCNAVMTKKEIIGEWKLGD